MKIKIVLTQNIDVSSDEDYSSINIIRQGITDWEEVSQEDYDFLISNLWRMHLDYKDLSPTILVQDDVPVIQRINSIKERIQEEKIKQEKEKAARQAQKDRRAAERQAKKELLTIESEKAMLEYLKKRYESENNP